MYRLTRPKGDHVPTHFHGPEEGCPVTVCGNDLVIEPKRDTTARKARNNGWKDARSAPARTPAPPTPPPTPPPIATTDNVEPDPAVLSGYASVVLDGTIDELEDALDAGNMDGELGLVLASERDGKNRKGAVEIIEDRMSSGD